MHLFGKLSVFGALCLASFATFCPPGQTEDSKDQLVEVISATRLSKSDAELIEKNHSVLQSNQQLIEKVLSHLRVDYYVPKMPKYRSLGANSILSLLDQMYYAAAAKKLGAAMPESFIAESGSSVNNNCFLHLYNNEILRAIAKKLDLKVPERTPESKDAVPYSSKVINQNHEILTKIAQKLGVKP